MQICVSWVSWSPFLHSSEFSLACIAYTKVDTPNCVAARQHVHPGFVKASAHADHGSMLRVVVPLCFEGLGKVSITARLWVCCL